MAFTIRFLSQFPVHWTKFDPKQRWFILLLKSHHQLVAISAGESSSGLDRTDLSHILPCAATNGTASGRRKEKEAVRNLQEYSAALEMFDAALLVCCSWSAPTLIDICTATEMTDQPGQSSLCLRAYVWGPGGQRFSSFKHSSREEKSPAFKSYFSLYSSINFSFPPRHVQPLKRHDFCKSSDHSLLEGLIQRNNIRLTPQSVNDALGDQTTLFGLSVLTKLLVANRCWCWGKTKSICQILLFFCDQGWYF